MPMRYYQRITDTCVPYLIARPPVLADLDRSPLFMPIQDAHIFDPQRVEGRVFLNLVKRLDALAYVPMGMEMPSWVFYDCAVMPGAVFGFAQPAKSMTSWAKRSLDVPADYDGLVPLSLFIVIPTVDRTTKLGYSLCSLNQVGAGTAPEGLWRMTLAAGTRALRVSEMLGVCQWRSPRLGLYAGLGPLEIETAWTPAHDNPTTVTFRVKVDAAARERLLRGDMTGPEGIDHYLDADDFGAMQALQDAIEAGSRVAIVGPAEIRGDQTRVPLQILDGDDNTFAVDTGPQFVRRFQG